MRRPPSLRRGGSTVASALSVDAPDILERIDSQLVARLATSSPDAVPHIVPICFALAWPRLYFAIDSKPKRGVPLRRIRNIQANPSVAVLFDHYEDDWSRLWWVRLDGIAVVLGPGPETVRALSLLAARYPPYRELPPPGPVIAVEIGSLSRWTGAGG